MFENKIQSEETWKLYKRAYKKSLKFPGTRFQNNGTDIDNRCGHALELDEAVFE